MPAAARLAEIGLPDFGLPSDSQPLGEILAGAGLSAGGVRRVGLAGWKYFGSGDGQQAERWIEAPAYLVEELRALGCEPVNASALFVRPGLGLRLVNDIDQIACFEFAATHGSESMRRLLLGVQPGMTEHEAFSLFRPIGLPFSIRSCSAASGRRWAWPARRRGCCAAATP
jgi:hypothetical protein